MAIKINFSNINTVLPSWDGPMKCPKCEGHAYTIGGPDHSQTMVFRSWCFDCDWNEKEEKE